MQKKADLIWHTLSYGLLFLPDIRFFLPWPAAVFRSYPDGAYHWHAPPDDDTRFRRRLIGKRKNQTHPCYCQYPCNDPIKLFFHAILLLFTGFYPLKPLSPSESGYHMPRHKKLHLCRDIRIPVQYPAQFRHREYNFRSE